MFACVQDKINFHLCLDTKPRIIIGLHILNFLHWIGLDAWRYGSVALFLGEDNTLGKSRSFIWSYIQSCKYEKEEWKSRINRELEE